MTTFGKFVESFCEWSFPLIATLGISGNSITLLVLTSKQMKSSTNTMLALAAMCDIFYLLSMFPNQMSRWRSLIIIPCIGDNGQVKECLSMFARFFIHNKNHVSFFVNWFSAASTWHIVVVSFDRLWAIKSPFSARSSRSYAWCAKKDMIIIPIIFILTFSSCFHMNFSFVAKNGTMVANQTPAVVHVFTVFNMVINILIPMLLLITLNSCLIYYLRNRRAVFEPKKGISARNSTRSDDLPAPLLNGNGERSDVVRNLSANSGMWCRHVGKAERHVTVTVAAIVTCYIVSHIPSAMVYGYMYFFHLDTIYGEGWMYTLTAMSTFIVTCSKTANFLLFCMSSKHFRQEMQKKVCFMFKSSEPASYKDSAQQPRTRSLPLNIIGDSTNNLSID